MLQEAPTGGGARGETPTHQQSSKRRDRDRDRSTLWSRRKSCRKEVDAVEGAVGAPEEGMQNMGPPQHHRRRPQTTMVRLLPTAEAEADGRGAEGPGLAHDWPLAGGNLVDS
jgi:hypothetical protein